MGRPDPRRRAQPTDDGDLLCKRCHGSAVPNLLCAGHQSKQSAQLRLDEIERSLHMYSGVRRMHDTGCLPLLLLIAVQPCGMFTNESPCSFFS